MQSAPGPEPKKSETFGTIIHAKSLANWHISQRQSQAATTAVLVTLPLLATPFCKGDIFHRFLYKSIQDGISKMEYRPARHDLVVVLSMPGPRQWSM